MLDFEHGLLLGIIGCTVTIVGFFIAFLVVNHNIRLEQRRKVKDTGPMADLNKSIYGEDCQ